MQFVPDLIISSLEICVRSDIEMEGSPLRRLMMILYLIISLP